MGGTSSAPAVAYSVEIGDKHAGEGRVRRNPASLDTIVSVPDEKTKTLYDNFRRGVEKSGNGHCLGSRVKNADGSFGEYVWKTYNQVDEMATKFASAFIHLNLAPRHPAGSEVVNGRIGLYSINREEWAILEIACNMQSIISVPLYDTLGPDAVQFIVNQAELETVCCSADKASLVVGCKSNCPTLKYVVQYEKAGEAEKAAAQAAGVTLLDLDTLLHEGTSHPVAHNPPQPEEFATFCYTSGTTGDPKGAMLSHQCMIADVTGVRLMGADIVSDDVHISYLPLAHMFERLVQVACFYGGAAIGFYQGSPLKLLDDLMVLRPTLFPSVPRLFNRIYERIVGQVNAGGGMKKKLFWKAYAAKKEGLAHGTVVHGFWDKVVFKKVRARLGGRIRLMITGSAPIAPEVMEFLRICFSVPVMEGYGQTECSAAATLTRPQDTTLGHVGGPLPCNEIKLVDVPDMNYTSDDKDEHGNPMPRGEVCYRGNNIFGGYFRDAAKTAEAVDSDGWLHSGDIGQWLPNGALKIIDRKKNIFKLAQGEYVAAEKIENAYATCPYVAQSFVYGDSLKSHLVAIIIPNEETLMRWAQSKGMTASFKELCADPEVSKFILEEMTKAGKQQKLRGFEVVRQIHVDSNPFTVENNLLTPTFKLKRNDAKKVYLDDINRLYATELPAAPDRGGL
eukprot:GILJ01000306.1.p1 GENE.GILJ01000306.1~~GILJ01000306.1.p1  ORF type:complete len:692 (-),score=129.63 GILJ01000306.1:157-2187(-)